MLFAARPWLHAGAAPELTTLSLWQACVCHFWCQGLNKEHRASDLDVLLLIKSATKHFHKQTITFIKINTFKSKCKWKTVHKTHTAVKIKWPLHLQQFYKHSGIQDVSSNLSVQAISHCRELHPGCHSPKSWKVISFTMCCFWSHLAPNLAGHPNQAIVKNVKKYVNNKTDSVRHPWGLPAQR